MGQLLIIRAKTRIFVDLCVNSTLFSDSFCFIRYYKTLFCSSAGNLDKTLVRTALVRLRSSLLPVGVV